MFKQRGEVTHTHLSPARFSKNFHYLLKASLENHLPEETTYEQRHFFVGPKVLLISNPSLNLGGKSKRSPYMKRKILGFQVEVQRAWGNKGLPGCLKS